MIMDKMNLDRKSVKTKEVLMQWIEKEYAEKLNKEFGEILITAGAGDIDMMVEPIKKLLKEI